MNEQKEITTEEKTNDPNANLYFKKMYVFKLRRSREEDKKGRPIIFLKFFGKKSLVWEGTGIKRRNDNEAPVEIMLDPGKITYFYYKGITPVETKYLKFWPKYKDSKEKGEEVKIPIEKQQELAIKLTELTELTGEKNFYNIIKQNNNELEKLKKTKANQKIVINQLQNSRKILKEKNLKKWMENKTQYKKIKEQEAEINNLKNILIEKENDYQDIKNKYDLLKSEHNIIKSQSEKQNSSENERE